MGARSPTRAADELTGHRWPSRQFVWGTRPTDPASTPRVTRSRRHAHDFEAKLEDLSRYWLRRRSGAAGFGFFAATPTSALDQRRAIHAVLFCGHSGFVARRAWTGSLGHRMLCCAGQRLLPGTAWRRGALHAIDPDHRLVSGCLGGDYVDHRFPASPLLRTGKAN